MSVKNAIRDMIDNLRMAIPGGRQFLDKSKDLSIYDVDDPNLPLVNKTITIDNNMKVKVKKTKK
jgi:hypothetical protein